MIHLADPAAALRRAAGRLRPGGVIAVQEPDMAYDWACPQTPLWQRVHDWFLRAAEGAGLETRTGLRLHRYFREAGLPVPELSLEATVIDMDGPDVPSRAYVSVVVGMLPLMERFGIATAAEVGPDTLADRLQAEITAASGYMITPPMYGAAARTASCAQLLSPWAGQVSSTRYCLAG